MVGRIRPTRLTTRPSSSRAFCKRVIPRDFLGLGFMIEGAKMMSQNWWVGGIALLGTSMLLTWQAHFYS
jgi:hypothetical protein